MDTHTFAPIIVSIDFCFSVGDQIARATFECPFGDLPSKEQVAEVAAKVRQHILAQFPDAKWTDRKTLMQMQFEEKTGTGGLLDFAVPGPNSYEAEWANA